MYCQDQGDRKPTQHLSEWTSYYFSSSCYISFISYMLFLSSVYLFSLHFFPFLIFAFLCFLPSPLLKWIKPRIHCNNIFISFLFHHNSWQQIEKVFKRVRKHTVCEWAVTWDWISGILNLRSHDMEYISLCNIFKC